MPEAQRSLSCSCFRLVLLINLVIHISCWRYVWVLYDKPIGSICPSWISNFGAWWTAQSNCCEPGSHQSSNCAIFPWCYGVCAWYSTASSYPGGVSGARDCTDKAFTYFLQYKLTAGDRIQYATGQTACEQSSIIIGQTNGVFGTFTARNVDEIYFQPGRTYYITVQMNVPGSKHFNTASSAKGWYFLAPVYTRRSGSQCALTNVGQKIVISSHFLVQPSYSGYAICQSSGQLFLNWVGYWIKWTCADSFSTTWLRLYGSGTSLVSGDASTVFKNFYQTKTNDRSNLLFCRHGGQSIYVEGGTHYIDQIDFFFRQQKNGASRYYYGVPMQIRQGTVKITKTVNFIWQFAGDQGTTPVLPLISIYADANVILEFENRPADLYDGNHRIGQYFSIDSSDSTRGNIAQNIGSASAIYVNDGTPYNIITITGWSNTKVPIQTLPYGIAVVLLSSTEYTHFHLEFYYEDWRTWVGNSPWHLSPANQNFLCAIYARYPQIQGTVYFRQSNQQYHVGICLQGGPVTLKSFTVYQATNIGYIIKFTDTSSGRVYDTENFIVRDSTGSNYVTFYSLQQSSELRNPAHRHLDINAVHTSRLQVFQPQTTRTGIYSYGWYLYFGDKVSGFDVCSTCTGLSLGTSSRLIGRSYNDAGPTTSPYDLVLSTANVAAGGQLIKIVGAGASYLNFVQIDVVNSNGESGIKFYSGSSGTVYLSNVDFGEIAADSYGIHLAGSSTARVLDAGNIVWSSVSGTPFLQTSGGHTIRDFNFDIPSGKYGIEISGGTLRGITSTNYFSNVGTPILVKDGDAVSIDFHLWSDDNDKTCVELVDTNAGDGATSFTFTNFRISDPDTIDFIMDGDMSTSTNSKIECRFSSDEVDLLSVTVTDLTNSGGGTIDIICTPYWFKNIITGLCTECLPNFKADCSGCLYPNADIVTNCVTCLNDPMGRKILPECDTCEDYWDFHLASIVDCTSCHNRYTPDCTQCDDPLYDPDRDCLLCENDPYDRKDVATCLSCKSGWTDFADACSTCLASTAEEFRTCWNTQTATTIGITADITINNGVHTLRSAHVVLKSEGGSTYRLTTVSGISARLEMSGGGEFENIDLKLSGDASGSFNIHEGQYTFKSTVGLHVAAGVGFFCDDPDVSNPTTEVSILGAVIDVSHTVPAPTADAWGFQFYGKEISTSGTTVNCIGSRSLAAIKVDNLNSVVTLTSSSFATSGNGVCIDLVSVKKLSIQTGNTFSGSEVLPGDRRHVLCGFINDLVSGEIGVNVLSGTPTFYTACELMGVANGATGMYIASSAIVKITGRSGYQIAAGGVGVDIDGGSPNIEYLSFDQQLLGTLLRCSSGSPVLNEIDFKGVGLGDNSVLIDVVGGSGVSICPDAGRCLSSSTSPITFTGDNAVAISVSGATGTIIHNFEVGSVIPENNKGISVTAGEVDIRDIAFLGTSDSSTAISISGSGGVVIGPVTISSVSDTSTGIKVTAPSTAGSVTIKEITITDVVLGSGGGESNGILINGDVELYVGGAGQKVSIGVTAGNGIKVVSGTNAHLNNLHFTKIVSNAIGIRVSSGSSVIAGSTTSSLWENVAGDGIHNLGLFQLSSNTQDTFSLLSGGTGAKCENRCAFYNALFADIDGSSAVKLIDWTGSGTKEHLIGQLTFGDITNGFGIEYVDAVGSKLSVSGVSSASVKTSGVLVDVPDGLEHQFSGVSADIYAGGIGVILGRTAGAAPESAQFDGISFPLIESTAIGIDIRQTMDTDPVVITPLSSRSTFGSDTTPLQGIGINNVCSPLTIRITDFFVGGGGVGVKNSGTAPGCPVTLTTGNNFDVRVNGKGIENNVGGFDISGTAFIVSGASAIGVELKDGDSIFGSGSAVNFSKITSAGKGIVVNGADSVSLRDVDITVLSGASSVGIEVGSTTTSAVAIGTDTQQCRIAVGAGGTAIDVTSGAFGSPVVDNVYFTKIDATGTGVRVASGESVVLAQSANCVFENVAGTGIHSQGSVTIGAVGFGFGASFSVTTGTGVSNSNAGASLLLQGGGAEISLSGGGTGIASSVGSVDIDAMTIGAVSGGGTALSVSGGASPVNIDNVDVKVGTGITDGIGIEISDSSNTMTFNIGQNSKVALKTQGVDGVGMKIDGASAVNFGNIVTAQACQIDVTTAGKGIVIDESNAVLSIQKTDFLGTNNANAIGVDIVNVDMFNLEQQNSFQGSMNGIDCGGIHGTDGNTDVGMTLMSGSPTILKTCVFSTIVNGATGISVSDDSIVNSVTIDTIDSGGIGVYSNQGSASIESIATATAIRGTGVRFEGSNSGTINGFVCTAADCIDGGTGISTSSSANIDVCKSAAQCEVKISSGFGISNSNTNGNLNVDKFVFSSGVGVGCVGVLSATTGSGTTTFDGIQFQQTVTNKGIQIRDGNVAIGNAVPCSFLEVSGTAIEIDGGDSVTISNVTIQNVNGAATAKGIDIISATTDTRIVGGTIAVSQGTGVDCQQSGTTRINSLSVTKVDSGAVGVDIATLSVVVMDETGGNGFAQISGTAIDNGGTLTMSAVGQSQFDVRAGGIGINSVAVGASTTVSNAVFNRIDSTGKGILASSDLSVTNFGFSVTGGVGIEKTGLTSDVSITGGNSSTSTSGSVIFDLQQADEVDIQNINLRPRTGTGISIGAITSDVDIQGSVFRDIDTPTGVAIDVTTPAAVLIGNSFLGRAGFDSSGTIVKNDGGDVIVTTSVIYVNGANAKGINCLSGTLDVNNCRADVRNGGDGISTVGSTSISDTEFTQIEGTGAVGVRVTGDTTTTLSNINFDDVRSQTIGVLVTGASTSAQISGGAATVTGGNLIDIQNDASADIDGVTAEVQAGRAVEVATTDTITIDGLDLTDVFSGAEGIRILSSATVLMGLDTANSFRANGTAVLVNSGGVLTFSSNTLSEMEIIMGGKGVVNNGGDVTIDALHFLDIFNGSGIEQGSGSLDVNGLVIDGVSGVSGVGIDVIGGAVVPTSIEIDGLDATGIRSTAVSIDFTDPNPPRNVLMGANSKIKIEVDGWGTGVYVGRMSDTTSSTIVGDITTTSATATALEVETITGSVLVGATSTFAGLGQDIDIITAKSVHVFPDVTFSGTAEISCGAFGDVASGITALWIESGAPTVTDTCLFGTVDGVGKAVELSTSAQFQAVVIGKVSNGALGIQTSGSASATISQAVFSSIEGPTGLGIQTSGTGTSTIEEIQCSTNNCLESGGTVVELNAPMTNICVNPVVCEIDIESGTGVIALGSSSANIGNMRFAGSTAGAGSKGIVSSPSGSLIANSVAFDSLEAGALGFEITGGTLFSGSNLQFDRITSSARGVAVTGGPPTSILIEDSNFSAISASGVGVDLLSTDGSTDVTIEHNSFSPSVGTAAIYMTPGNDVNLLQILRNSIELNTTTEISPVIDIAVTHGEIVATNNIIEIDGMNSVDTYRIADGVVRVVTDSPGTATVRIYNNNFGSLDSVELGKHVQGSLLKFVGGGDVDVVHYANNLIYGVSSPNISHISFAVGTRCAGACIYGYNYIQDYSNYVLAVENPTGSEQIGPNVFKEIFVDGDPSEMYILTGFAAFTPLVDIDGNARVGAAGRMAGARNYISQHNPTMDLCPNGLEGPNCDQISCTIETPEICCVTSSNNERLRYCMEGNPVSESIYLKETLYDFGSASWNPGFASRDFGSWNIESVGIFPYPGITVRLTGLEYCFFDDNSDLQNFQWGEDLTGGRFVCESDRGMFIRKEGKAFTSKYQIYATDYVPTAGCPYSQHQVNIIHDGDLRELYFNDVSFYEQEIGGYCNYGIIVHNSGRRRNLQGVAGTKTEVLFSQFLNVVQAYKDDVSETIEFGGNYFFNDDVQHSTNAYVQVEDNMVVRFLVYSPITICRFG